MSNRFTAPWSEITQWRCNVPLFDSHARTCLRTGGEEKVVKSIVHSSFSPLRYDTARCPQTPRHTLLFPSCVEFPALESGTPSLTLLHLIRQFRLFL
ncbi:MAG: hypothetical protein J1F38_11150 [Muribaculaceae bacterium]|nr:hypothetical protein [Muribaculaceae bacterium]